MAANNRQAEQDVELVLIRGLPGSGKTTIAKTMERYFNVEADMYFMQDGIYKFEPEKLHEAHAWCLAQTTNALREGKSVVVSNTFTRLFEIEPYLALGFPVRIIEAKGEWQNTHGVSPEHIEVMRKRWEVL